LPACTDDEQATGDDDRTRPMRIACRIQQSEPDMGKGAQGGSPRLGSSSTTARSSSIDDDVGKYVFTL
jgi:hypothetical protein